VLVLPWLGPFVVAYLEAGTPTVLATTYVNEASYVRLVSAEASPWLALALAGAVALLGVSGEQFRLLRGCQALLLTVLLFGVLQLLGGQVGRGVLFHRAQIVLGVTLLAGGTLAIALGGPRLRAALVRRLPGVRLPQLGAAVLGVALFLGLSGHGADWMARDDAWRGRAHDRPTPDGRLSPLASGEARQAAGAQLTVAELAAAVERVSAEAGRPADAVVLTDIRELMATTPVFGYLQWWELYSNPLGEYPRRKAFVERLARTDPAEFPATLRSEPDGPTVFLLRVDGDQVSYRSSGWDPDRARTTPWSVRLPAAALESPDFASTRVDDWLVAALRTR
jgi:galactan 5-O-arabinofuranosyltransferase